MERLEEKKKEEVKVPKEKQFFDEKMFLSPFKLENYLESEGCTVAKALIEKALSVAAEEECCRRR
jgi:hypothetical protein